MKRWNVVLLVLLLVMPLLLLPSCGSKKALKSSVPSTPIVEKTPEAPPPTVPAAPTKPEEAVTLEDIYFDYDKSTLRSDAQATLAKHAQTLLERMEVTIRVEGHCDERGTVEYNLALGERRAQAVLGYFASYGVPRDRMSTVSFGEERPVDPGHDERAWAKNRRAAFVVVRGE